MRSHITIITCGLLLLLSSVAGACNICGPGTDHVMGNGRAVVELEIEPGVRRKQNCETWTTILPAELCTNHLLVDTVEVCQCLQKDGSLVVWTLPSVIAHVPELSLFREAIAEAGADVILNDPDQNITLLVPTNTAMEESKEVPTEPARRKDLVEYHILTQNWNGIPADSQELATTAANCSHIWVTNQNDKICFNDACVVPEQDGRSPMLTASNG